MKFRAVIITTAVIQAVAAAGSYFLGRKPAPGPAASPGRIFLSDVTGTAGIAFRHESGARGKMLNPETFGPGGGWFDHDGDGLLDLLLVNGNLLDSSLDQSIQPVLYRNVGAGGFKDVMRCVGRSGGTTTR